LKEKGLVSIYNKTYSNNSCIQSTVYDMLLYKGYIPVNIRMKDNMKRGSCHSNDL